MLPCYAWRKEGVVSQTTSCLEAFLMLLRNLMCRGGLACRQAGIRPRHQGRKTTNTRQFLCLLTSINFSKF